MDEARVTFQILIAGNTLAGLTLVFLGNIATSYQSYASDEKSSVRASYQWRGWLAFSGFVCSLLSALCAFGYNWFQSTYLVYGGAILLGAAILFVIVSAVNTAQGIR